MCVFYLQLHRPQILALRVSPGAQSLVAYGDPEGASFVCDIEGENSQPLLHHDCAVGGNGFVLGDLSLCGLVHYSCAPILGGDLQIQALTWIDSNTLVVGSKDASVSFWRNSATVESPEWKCIKTVACQDDSIAALANYKVRRALEYDGREKASLLFARASLMLPWGFASFFFLGGGGCCDRMKAGPIMGSRCDSSLGRVGQSHQSLEGPVSE